MKDILSKTKNNDLTNIFIEDKNRGSSIFVVVTSDKGLCGGYNSAVLKLAMEKISEHKHPAVVSLGIIGDKMLRDKGVKIKSSWYGASQHPTMNLASQVADKLIKLYLTEKYHEVYVIYTEFINSSFQEPKCVRLLPLLRRDFLDVDREGDKNAQMIYEPSFEEVFDQLVHQYITGFMYDVFMQASASENIARMTAMQNATRNADDMISELSTDLNAARQLQITNEITEISAAAEMGGV